MKDYLGNPIGINDTVIIAVQDENTILLGKATVNDMERKPLFEGELNMNMVYVEYNDNKHWLPARNVVKIPEDMIPEKRRERLIETAEAVQP